MSTDIQIIKSEMIDTKDYIDKLLAEEDFSAYHRIKESFIDAVNFLDKNQIAESQKEIAFCIRLIMEAPPKNKNLGYDTLLKMDSIYQKLSLLVN